MNPRYQQQQCAIYTWELPYISRKLFCDILDADGQWKLIGGQFCGLDDTQLTLVGQAFLRQSSPTEELLSKLDVANVRITDLCSFMLGINHLRAYEILKPYVASVLKPTDFYQGQYGVQHGNNNKQPSISLAYSQLDNAIKQYPSNMMIDHQAQALSPCHKSPLMYPTNQVAQTLLVQNSHLVPFVPQPTAQHQQNVLIQEFDHQDQTPPPQISSAKRASISDQEYVNQLRLIMQIEFRELRQASDNFSASNILGNGGFASVYRGKWKGTDVAIKRLKCNLMDQALNELTILNSYRIDNILPIYGISIDGPEACLVYQFMSNGSLEDRLACKHDSVPLSWRQRADIGEGLAKALFYLHTLRSKPLVHGDVKSANVLLDGQFVAKLGDFGLARQLFKTGSATPQAPGCNKVEQLTVNQNAMMQIPSQEVTHCTVTSIHGTSVYLPPEYLRHKILSPAVDVYSYGIVLLEMATGCRAYDGKRLLVDVVEDEAKSLSMGQISVKLKDKRLASTTSQVELRIWLELLIKLGLNCANKTKKKRPDMGSVLRHFSSFDWRQPSISFNLNNQQQATSESSDLRQSLARPAARKRPIIVARRSGVVRSPIPEVDSIIVAGKTAGNAKKGKKNESETSKQQIEVEAMIPLITELGIDKS